MRRKTSYAAASRPISYMVCWEGIMSAGILQTSDPSGCQCPLVVGSSGYGVSYCP